MFKATYLEMSKSTKEKGEVKKSEIVLYQISVWSETGAGTFIDHGHGHQYVIHYMFPFRTSKKATYNHNQSLIKRCLQDN